MDKENTDITGINSEGTKEVKTKMEMTKGCVLSPRTYSIIFDEAIKEAKKTLK